jgi:hypothetical protein
VFLVVSQNPCPFGFGVVDVAPLHRLWFFGSSLVAWSGILRRIFYSFPLAYFGILFILGAVIGFFGVRDYFSLLEL